jgi:5-methylcytosine-specific restriction endonuclease McrA
MHATPPWLTEIQKMQIAWFYSAAKMMTETSGKKHHVDHIHPLQGDGFTGLHVPWNLRIINAVDNIQKGNKLPQELQHLVWERI